MNFTMLNGAFNWNTPSKRVIQLKKKVIEVLIVSTTFFFLALLIEKGFFQHDYFYHYPYSNQLKWLILATLIIVVYYKDMIRAFINYIVDKDEVNKKHTKEDISNMGSKEVQKRSKARLRGKDKSSIRNVRMVKNGNKAHLDRNRRKEDKIQFKL